VRNDTGTASLLRAPEALLAGLRQLLYGADRPIGWPPDRLRWLRWSARIAVVVATAVLYPVTLLTVAGSHPGGPDALVFVLALPQLLPLVLALRYPLLGWRIGLLAALVEPALADAHRWAGWPWEPAQVPMLGLAFVLAGLRYGRAVLWWMYVAMAGVLFLRVDLSDAPGGLVLLTVATVLVDLAGGRIRAQRALAAETERTEREKARRSVLEERARIARELHDVVAHHMSLIAVQAETAPYRRDDITPGAADELASISAQARQALAEMRRLLGVLRSDEAALRGPQPTLSDVERLVADSRRAGVPVRMTAPAGVGTRVPEQVQVCAYRVVQEALSNATRHAPGADIAVELAVTGDAVRLAVRNGPGGAGPVVPGAGHGLIGMRERVGLLGGDLAVGPDPDGGFTVAATLPYGPEPAEPSPGRPARAPR